MAKTDADLTQQLPSAYRFWPHPATDYIDMDLVIRDLEDPIRNAIFAAKFEATAAVHRALADGAAKVANILSRGVKGA